MNISEDDTDILKTYADEFTKLIDHMLSNPMLTASISGNLLMATGSHFFKLGHSLKVRRHPSALENYTIVLAPDEYMDEVKEMLTNIQNKALKKALDTKLKDATNDKEIAEIHALFEQATKDAPFKYVEPLTTTTTTTAAAAVDG